MTQWAAVPTHTHLEAIRAHELRVTLEEFPPNGKVLELGAGAGWQAKALADLNYEVEAIDIATSNYKKDIIWKVTEYDGHHIPFEDNYFDVIFSSNVLEHIPHVGEFQKEIQRVLKPTGKAIHLMPSSGWRLLTTITHAIKYWTPCEVHGEFARFSTTEIYYFSRYWWRKLFLETGWTIKKVGSAQLLYSGTSLFDSRLSIRARNRLSSAFGSSCNIFVLTKKTES